MSKVLNYSLSRFQKNGLKLLLMSVALFVMYFQLKNEGSFSELKNVLLDLGNDFDKLFVLIVVFLLMYLNWGLEAFKFQFLIRRFYPIKYGKALMATLSGVTFSLFMPNRTGEYIGRVLHLKRGSRIKAILATILGSMSQLLVTVFFGLFAILISIGRWNEANETFKLAFYFGSTFLLLFTLVILFYKRLVEFIYNSNYLKSVTRFLIVFKLYDKSDLLKISSISAIRYFVFSLQFVLLLILFCPELTLLNAFAGVMTFFLVQSVIPGTGITELLTRGALVIALFNGLVDNTASLLATTYILWVVNLFVPAIIGAVFILTMRLFD